MPPWDELLGDSGDGRRTGILHPRVGTLLDDGWWSVEEPGDPLRLEGSSSLAPSRLVSEILRPAAMVQVARLGGVTLHASAVLSESGPLLLAGWSEAGKTETALAFVESGARMVADKWTLLRPDRRPLGYPGAVQVREWVLPYLSSLRSHVTRRMRMQVAAARLAGSVPALIQRLPGPSARDVARRLAAITDLGSRIRLSLDDLALEAHVPPTTEPVRRLALLRVRPGSTVDVSAASAESVVEPLLISAFHERQGWRSLVERASFASRPVDLSSLDVIDLERASLREMLADIEVLIVKAPFPSDPRRIRDAIMEYR
jgi:hypothetical protein